MTEIFSIEFNYRSDFYYALIKTKEQAGLREFYITVMNGALEKNLNGYRVCFEREGKVFPHQETPPDETTELFSTIMKKIEDHIKNDAPVEAPAGFRERKL